MRLYVVKREASLLFYSKCWFQNIWMCC